MDFVLSSSPASADLLFVLLYKDDPLPTSLKKALKKNTKSQVEARLKAKDFEGEEGQALTLFVEGESHKRLILLGRGEKSKELPKALEELGGKIAGLSGQAKAKKITVVLPDEDVSELGYGLALGSYRFTRYTKPDKKKVALEKVQIIASPTPVNKKRVTDFGVFKKVADPMRDLINTAACDLHPMEVAAAAQKLGKAYKMKVTVLDIKKLEKLGCGTLIGVGKGAENPPCMVIMEYRYKSKSNTPNLAFIGKGITFDTGGLNLKPTGYIETMKLDMSGAATVMATLHALAESKVPGYFIAVLACAENAISDRAQRPGDIAKSYNGKTVEITNTDGEGRLVLADALAYTEKNYKPKAMVDIATLTGAVTVALGYHITGVLGNDEKLLDGVLNASKIVHERMWKLPLDEDFIKWCKGDCSDLKNASDGVRAGTIMGAAFLKHFVEKTPWVHLDIGGTAWAEKPSSTTQYGATTAGLRTLIELGKAYSG